MLGVVGQDKESGLKEVKSERDLLPQKTFSTKGTNTEIAAVGNDRFLTWLFNKAYNVCMKEKERTVVEETDLNPMTVVNSQQAVEGAEDGIEVSDKCGDDIVDISVCSDAASDDHQIDLICTAVTESLRSQSDDQLDKSQDRNLGFPNKTLPVQTRKRKLTGNTKVVDQKKRKGTQSLKEKIRKVLKCTYCLKTFKSKRNLTHHQRDHTKKQLYTTKICEKESTMQSNYLQIHTGEKPYKCTHCDKAFGAKDSLNIHFRRHTREKPYKCTLCDKAFSSKGTLNIHLRMHTGGKLFKCTVCDKAFTTNSTMNAHLRIHTGRKLFKCTVCDKAFTTKGNMKSHLQIHTGLKPYKCTMCKKAFTAKGNLKIHLRVHTGEKPHKCTVCGKAFTQIGTLNKHLQIHLSC